ncbi:Miro domain containing protein [Nitzschia inconspicua]|uniref:Miro domain containing protein n=1 Tax=Nitzschia inconspicua TaxID=303405 RepID=A0A9K3PDV5_9STRA|nr:Miro domain containing protein [Nitzschia inconspicua]
MPTNTTSPQPRPIHSSHDQLRDTPDESEPSYSYEETSFLAQKEDDVEDEFHRRFMLSSTTNSSSNNNNSYFSGRLGGGSTNSNIGLGVATRGSTGSVDAYNSQSATGRSSFWRTEATPQWQSRGGTTSSSSSSIGAKKRSSGPEVVLSSTSATTDNNKRGPQKQTRKGGGGVMGRLVGSGRNISSGFAATSAAAAAGGGFPARDTGFPKRERKTSGGLLGAALQLHSQGKESFSDKSITRNGSGGSEEQTAGNAVAVSTLHHAPLRKMSSSFSQNSLSSGDGKGIKKDLTRQRAEARRLKLDAQIHDVDIGRLETEVGGDEGGIPTSIGAPSTLMEEEEGDATTDGDSTTATNNPYASPPPPFSFADTGMNQNYGQRLLVDSMPAGETAYPPITTISTDYHALSHHDHGDRSVGGSTVSENDGVSTVSGSGKSLLYGRVPTSPAHDPSKLSTVVDQTSRGSIDGSISADQNNRSNTGGLGAGVLFGKSSSLIFPTGVVDTGGAASTAASAVTCSPNNMIVQKSSAELKSHKINLLLDQCETVRFPFKKKLMLNSMDLTAADIPIKDLYRTNLGNSLHKLSLAGNRLFSIPPKLVVCLPILKSLDLSQCELHQLPERWNLPHLKRLNLSHNRLTDFPEETMLEGVPELNELNMYGNKVSVIIVPHNPKLLSKLETLNLGYNDLAYLPEDLDRLKALRTLKVMNNFLEKIPMRVCDMELKSIDVSSNPVIQPPIETCERGICSMKRYYHCLRMEEQSKQKALEALQSKAAKHSKKQLKHKKSGGLGLTFAKPKRTAQTSTGRKTSDDSGSNVSSNLEDSHASTKLDLEHLPAQQSVGASSFLANGRSQSLQDDHLIASPSSALRPLSPSDIHPKSKSLSAATDRDQGLLVQESTKDSAEADRSSIEDHFEEKARPSSEDYSTKKVALASDWTSASSLRSEDFPMDTERIDQVTVNDTLKVIFVGMAMAGKTSMIKRLIEGENAVIPKRDERTIGVDIYEWDPKIDKRFEHIDSRIQLQDRELEELCGEVDVKFSVWDFAGQHVYHATHELFFSPRALYVLVWDMGATNPATRRRNKMDDDDNSGGAFKLTYDSDDDSDTDADDDDFVSEEEARRADRALERDIDEKVQFWVDCIQSSAPGSAILPVATFDDLFKEDDHHEAKRRCNILKQRLLRHEARRIQGIKDRLKEYVEQNRANDEAALRLRKLLGSYTRPKLIFGDDGDDSVVRVSGTEYTGFAELTERINNIATGRDKANFRYPIFRGHVGARIPRMRMEVLEAVRRMRDRFKVVEWGFFINELQKSGLSSVEDISDALHFLTNIGELSYFGGVLPGRPEQTRINPRDDLNAFTNAADTGRTKLSGSTDDVSAMSEDDEDDDENARLSIDDTSITMPSTDDGSLSTLSEALSAGLSQFVFLNPRWLVAAVACILRHDLDREIQETRRALRGFQRMDRTDSFYEANMNCPVITADDACMLWQAKKFTKKAAQRAVEYSNNITLKPFEFLQLLLIRFGVFVPIDLGMEKAILGGVEYSRRASNDKGPSETITTSGESNETLQATYFFLPSLLGPGEPAEAWTYKSTDSWKATLCHSVLFPDGVPPGLMERITASVLSNLYSMAHHQENPQGKDIAGQPTPSYEGKITVKEVLCWRTAFLVKLGMKSPSAQGEQKESIVEIFTALVDRESHLCVGSEFMSVGSRRLVTSGKGQEGDGGRKIWKGGYLVVLKAVQKVMDGYGGLEYEKQGFCPECLSKKGVGEASSWDLAVVRSAVRNGDTTIRCRHGHRVDTRLIAGHNDNLQQRKHEDKMQSDAIVPINDLLRGVVVVGLWDGRTRKVVRVGTGFIADKKRGLIVTASHTLMNIWGDRSTPFGENYYGLRQGKVVIGVIPRKKGEDSGTEAVFRYFAKIVAKDPSIDKGVCHLDACILRITTRMENDVAGSGEGCGDEPERLLLNNPVALKQEKLHQLKITDKCELDEQVRIVGYNQGGEGLMGPGVRLNRYVDFARGYVCKKFAGGEGSDGELRHRFKPREEIVVICPTIGGHSGGPCVNQQGEVIGILSRADPAESQRCYLVPTYEWRSLLRDAKNAF